MGGEDFSILILWGHILSDHKVSQLGGALGGENEGGWGQIPEHCAESLSRMSKNLGVCMHLALDFGAELVAGKWWVHLFEDHMICFFRLPQMLSSYSFLLFALWLRATILVSSTG